MSNQDLEVFELLQRFLREQQFYVSDIFDHGSMYYFFVDHKPVKFTNWGPIEVNIKDKTNVYLFSLAKVRDQHYDVHTFELTEPNALTEIVNYLQNLFVSIPIKGR